MSFPSRRTRGVTSTTPPPSVNVVWRFGTLSVLPPPYFSAEHFPCLSGQTYYDDSPSKFCSCAPFPFPETRSKYVLLFLVSVSPGLSHDPSPSLLLARKFPLSKLPSLLIEVGPPPHIPPTIAIHFFLWLSIFESFFSLLFFFCLCRWRR